MDKEFDQRWQQIFGDQFNAEHDINFVIQMIAPHDDLVDRFQGHPKSCQNGKEFVFSGSPFLPKIPDSFLDDVMNQIVTDQSPPQLVIAKDLMGVGGVHYEKLIHPAIMTEIYKFCGATGNDLFYYILGFTSPLVLISAAFFAELDGPRLANEYMRRAKESINQALKPSEEIRKLNTYLEENWSYCHDLLLKDTTCADIFTYTINSPFRQQTFYCVGLESARVTFFEMNIAILQRFGFTE